MKAEKAYKICAQTLRPPTPRKVYNRLKRWQVRDTYGELHWFFGLDLTPAQLREFCNAAE